MYQKIDCAKHWMFAHGFHVILHQLSTKRPHPSKSNPWVDQCLAIHSPFFIGLKCLTVKCCLAWNRYQIKSAKLHQDASAIFKQLLKPNMPFESSWATGWCQRQLSDTQHWWMSANLLKWEVLVVHASIYTNHFKTECLISYSYYFILILLCISLDP